MDVLPGLRSSHHPYRELVCELAKHFYHLKWAMGTGGGIAIRDDDEILVAPSGVQKERLRPQDLFVVDMDGNVIGRPHNPALKVSECLPLFMHAFKKRNAGAVIHSHSINAVLITQEQARYERNFRKPEMYQLFRTHSVEMIKGLRGKNCFDWVEIPIIPNTERECDLADTLGDAMDRFNDVDAVLVDGHGIYVWGETWEQAKTQAECLDYLFELHLRRR